tara:strand:+ start:697 stop:963 length:267 start_codon:yes stop_codon:yes gene_type:complete
MHNRGITKEATMALELTKEDILFDLYRMDPGGIHELSEELRLEDEAYDQDFRGESQESIAESARQAIAELILKYKLEDEFYDLVHGEE